MASVLNVLTDSWEIIRKQPTVLIPYTVIAILLIAVIGAAAVVLLVPSLIGIGAGGHSLSANQVITTIVGPVATTVGVAVVIGFFIGALLNGIYISLASQAKKGKKISFGTAFIAARKAYIRLLEVQLVTLIIYAVIALVILSPLLLRSLGPIFSGAIGAYTILVFAAAIILWLASMFLFLPSVIVVLENKGAWDAIKKSISVVGKRFWSVLKLYLALIGIGIVYSIVVGIIGLVPFIGAIITFIVAIVYATWNLLLPAIYYMDFVGIGKK
jgi:hypothetical protein